MTRATPVRCAAAACACVAIVAAGAGAQEYAQPGPPLPSVRATNCSMTDAKTITANRYVRVFKKTRRGFGYAYGCRRSADRAYRLGVVGECQNNDEVRQVEVSGRRAVVGLFSCSLYAAWWRVDLVNLRTGRREFTSAPFSLPPVGDATYDVLRRVVLTADGAVAWTAARQGAGGVPGGVEVRRRRRGTTNRAVLLDSGADIDPDSLRRRGRTVTWTKSGARRSAQL